MGLLDKILRAGEGRKVKQLDDVVERVAALEPEIEPLTDDELRDKTEEFRARLEEGEELDELMSEAFAVVREAARRTLGMRPFDVQVMGAVVLHQGSIAEMKTGEGKTLVATMPVYLNALPAKGVHVVTVNDYLAQRDAEWMGPVYEFLGLTVGAVHNAMKPEERREIYARDITYGTNTEFGFDYLRDNMAHASEGKVQRGHNFCIVDEVDSILVDEARTPLIISGAGEHAAKTYYDFARIAKQLKAKDVTHEDSSDHEGGDRHGRAAAEHDYEVDEKKKTVGITEEGLARVEAMLGLENLYEDLSGQLVNHLQQALKAQSLFKRDVDYLLDNGEVKIIDEYTGRVLEGRRYSEGLHQAIEAKEGVKIKQENQTLATITLQNYFRLYEKLSGMTGTAATEADEFREIYDMEVVVVPTNMPMIREDRDDLIYKTEKAKFLAVVEDIAGCYERGQPVLVGTISVEKSERLAGMLTRRGIPHEVLNAKQHAREAQIVECAGQQGAITIATNMAGRGTDIKLGDGVKAVGGLYVLGTERHESRRIDNQLRGRSGRQGDEGASRFYISLEDDLMRLFAGDRIYGMMDRLGLEEDVPIQHRLISRGVENAQKKVEEQNFAIRKRVLEYDDVMNKQREVIYGQRERILEGEDLGEDVREIIERVMRSKVAEFAAETQYVEEWDLEEFLTIVKGFFPATIDLAGLDLEVLTPEELADLVVEDALAVYESREEELGEETIRNVERWVLLRVLDAKWRDHLYEMDYLREGIGLRALAQRDPLVEYKSEGFAMFQRMMDSIQEDFVRYVYHVEITRPEQEESAVEKPRGDVTYVGPGVGSAGQPAAFGFGAQNPVLADTGRQQYESAQSATQTVTAPRHVDDKVGRNDPCPCGSGKKYKKCHGA